MEAFGRQTLIEQQLVLKNSNGQELIKIRRSPVLPSTDLKTARDDEVTKLTQLGFSLTYIAPEQGRNWSNWYILSGVNHGAEFYVRRWLCSDGVVSMEFNYGKELAPLFDSVIPKMTHELAIKSCS